jgi:predicted enzyme related to lactoylglutathione lyase
MSANPTGTYTWTDLLPGDDQARAIAFYSGLLGWSAEPGAAELGGYAIAHLGEPSAETAVAGINTRMGSEAPPQWTIYLATDDLDETLTRVGANGGTVAFGPLEIPGMGRTAYCVEPTGAGFGLWEAGPFAGFGPNSGEIGSFCWTEVYSNDAASTSDFFSAILGLESRPLSQTPEFTYFQMAVPTNPEGRQIQFGVMQISPGGPFPDAMPSVFRAYVSVDDVDAAVERAIELGGKVHVPVSDSPFGRMCTIADPDRADIVLIDLSQATAGS